MPIEDRTTVRVRKDYLKFSAGHLTLFNDGTRERLHGHDYLVALAMDIRCPSSGINFDYGYFKRHLKTICDGYDERVLLAGESHRVRVVRREPDFEFEVDGDRYLLPGDDVVVLPVPNVTVEELSGLLLKRLIEDCEPEVIGGLLRLAVTVEAGPGQSATSQWTGETT